jgi:hypothetical protein
MGQGTSTYRREQIGKCLAETNAECVYAARRAGKTRALLKCMHDDLADVCKDGNQATAIFVTVGMNTLVKVRGVWEDGGFEEGEGEGATRVALATPEGALVVWATSSLLASHLPSPDRDCAMLLYCDEGSFYLDGNDAMDAVMKRVVDAQGDGTVFRLRIVATSTRSLSGGDAIAVALKQYGANVRGCFQA